MENHPLCTCQCNCRQSLQLAAATGATFNPSRTAEKEHDALIDLYKGHVLPRISNRQAGQLFVDYPLPENMKCVIDQMRADIERTKTGTEAPFLVIGPPVGTMTLDKLRNYINGTNLRLRSSNRINNKIHGILGNLIHTVIEKGRARFYHCHPSGEIVELIKDDSIDPYTAVLNSDQGTVILTHIM